MALTHLERPFVYVEITKSGIRRRQPTLDRLERDGWLTMSCRNDGRTPADLWELTTEVHAIDETALARPLIPAPIGPRRLPTGTVASPTKPYARYIDDLKQQLGDNWVDVEVGKKLICLLGYLRYRDIFGSHYITGFCYVFDIVGMDFVLRGDDQYNYARQEAG
jgi:hypothetical protein